MSFFSKFHEMRSAVQVLFLVVILIFLILVGIIFYSVTYTDEGERTLSKIADAVSKQNGGTTTNITIKQATINLELRNEESHQGALLTLEKELAKLVKEKQEYEKQTSIVNIDKSDKLNFKIDEVASLLKKQQKIYAMSNNSDRVIRVGVESVSKYELFYKNIDFKREFFLAKLDELKDELSEDFLNTLNEQENKKIYAQLTMIKSISHYLDYEPDLAYRTYVQAKKAFPTLDVINELQKEYKDIYPEDAKELHYAYALIASVKKTEDNMNKTADRILSPVKAHQLREQGYNLYLSINQSSIRVYTIIEFYDDLEYNKKFLEIEKIEKTASVYRTTKELPREYILRETRKKVYIFNTSGRDDDKNLVSRLNAKGMTHLEAKGQWSVPFDVYAVYYDGNAYDKNDLNNFLEQTRNIIGSYAVKPFAYQQSNGKAVRDLFDDKYLKYVLILEKNAYIKK